MSQTQKALELLRDEFRAEAHSGPKLYHAMFHYRGVRQLDMGKSAAHCGGPHLCNSADDTGFEIGFYFRQPGTTFCKYQLTEFFRLSEATVRCIDFTNLPPLPTDKTKFIQQVLEYPTRSWLSALYRIAWHNVNPLLRAEPSVNGEFVGSELHYANHLVDDCMGGIRWRACVPLSPDVFLASSIAIDYLLSITMSERQFMELAISEARKCLGEGDRANPKVGAVVVKDGKVLAAAYRGELESGEHAEFTALEKKLSGEKLAGSTVYATLEPCTARNEPKIPCANRLIERKVRRVVIGMLDPNPAIRGLGVQMLIDHGVEVEHFPSELNVELHELNREFVREQKAKIHALPKEVPLVPPIKTGGLWDLHRRFIDAQDRFPREVAFAIAMIPNDERRAWAEVQDWFGDVPMGPVRPDGWRCMRYASGEDTAETVLLPATESNGPIKVPVISPLEAWRCWLLRQTPNSPYPTNALNLFLSLANDACRLLGIQSCGMQLKELFVPGKAGEFQHLMRWVVEQLSDGECQKMTWLDPPHHQTRFVMNERSTNKRWFVEMPCAFQAVAVALEKHLAGKGHPWPRPEALKVPSSS
jgi:pyrimidine deaminase RibD-like protein